MKRFATAVIAVLALVGCREQVREIQAAPGEPGAPGKTTLIRTATEPAGSNCPAGGTKIVTGIDQDSSGELEPSEVSSTAYVCNGARGSEGAPGAKGDTGDAGAQGPAGAPWKAFGEDGAEFAGFTVATYDGNSMGRGVMHARCSAEFAGSHMCHYVEYRRAHSPIIPPLPEGAWVDASGDVSGTGTAIPTAMNADYGRFTGTRGSSNGAPLYNCSNWTTNTTTAPYAFGTIVVPPNLSGGSGTVRQGDCSTKRPIACCSTPYRESFKGFTTATKTGAAGIEGFNAACNSEFAASHACHYAEYQRANPVAAVPSTDAWILPCDNMNFAGSKVSAVELNSISDCSGWTSNSNAQTGTTLQQITAGAPEGHSQATCDSALPIACCGSN